MCATSEADGPVYHYITLNFFTVSRARTRWNHGRRLLRSPFKSVRGSGAVRLLPQRLQEIFDRLVETEVPFLLSVHERGEAWWWRGAQRVQDFDDHDGHADERCGC